MSLPWLRPPAPAPLAYDREFVAPKQTPLRSEVGLGASKESHCALGAGLATPVTFSRPPWPRAPRERKHVSVRVRVRARAHTRLWLGARGPTSPACAAQRSAGPVGAWPSPAGGAGGSENSVIVRGAGRSPLQPAGRKPFSRQTASRAAAARLPRAPARAPPLPARHLSSARHCQQPWPASWTTPKGTRGLGRARGKQGEFIPSRIWR